ncbi:MULTISPECIES: HAD family hydrolase [unclassified Streptomyces]|uniref:HAD family hydrolase n=1 Tax=unclassified Streptomyces TaxID=2593676 RepID=UPI003867A616
MLHIEPGRHHGRSGGGGVEDLSAQDDLGAASGWASPEPRGNRNGPHRPRTDSRHKKDPAPHNSVRGLHRAPGRPCTCISPQEAGRLSLDHQRTACQRESHRPAQDQQYQTQHTDPTDPTDPTDQDTDSKPLEIRDDAPAAAVALLRDRSSAPWTCVIVSNGRTAQQEAKIRNTGLDQLVQGWVVSESIGHKKPEAQIFHAAAATVRLPLPGAWVIGDSPHADIAGAEALGLRNV